VGNNLETGLINVSLYKHFKLTGDFGSGMTPVADTPLHFTFNGQTWAPFFVADPRMGQAPPPETQEGRREQSRTQPYHMYVRRNEPTVVFGSVDSGIANAKRDDGMTFLDAVWAGAPFADHARFTASVERVATEWRGAGRMSAADESAIVQAARRAEKDLA